jgi:four helix bundle protein
MLLNTMIKNELEARLVSFSKRTIAFCKCVRLDTISRPLISQLIRSATSIGANYAEAQNAISRSDFRAKVYICKKESQETIYWLDLLETCVLQQYATELLALQQEAAQLTKIFQTITSKLT